MGDEQTPGPQRAISPTTSVRMTIERMIALIGAVVLMAYAVITWTNRVDNHVERVDKWMEKVDARLEVFGRALGVPPDTAASEARREGKHP